MYLLFDIGGTRTRVTTSQDGTNLNEIKIINTPDEFENIYDSLSEFKDIEFEAVAGGIAGVFDKDKDVLMRSPNLPGWEGKSIKSNLQDYFNTQVYLENDANLAGLGEACYGAGRDYKIVAYLTVSTGIGGVRIVDKKIDQCLWGFEPGHQIIDVDVTLWPQSRNFYKDSLAPGSISAYISGAALASRHNKDASEIKDPLVWDEVEKLLAVSIYNSTLHWSPQIFILGGGMIIQNAVSIEKTKDHFENLMKIFPEIPELKKAELGDASALYGSLSLIKNEIPT